MSIRPTSDPGRARRRRTRRRRRRRAGRNWPRCTRPSTRSRTGSWTAIQFGITLDALHAEVEVALLERSADLVGARSEPDGHGGADRHLLQLEPDDDGDDHRAVAERVRIDGWIAPGAGVQVEIHTSGGERTAIADANGRFVFDDVHRGPLQFLLRSPAELNRRPVVTPTITV